jgi:hypothetical protein
MKRNILDVTVREYLEKMKGVDFSNPICYVHLYNQ